MDRTHRLRDYAGAGPGDVSDPYGRDLVVYSRTLQELEDLVHRSLQRWSDRDAREREGPSEPGRLE
jgi:hypothetical protein